MVVFLALYKSYDCLSVTEATLKDLGTLNDNHNKTQQKH